MDCETIYQLNLLAAQLAVVPTFAFKPIFGILTLPLRLLTCSGAKVMEKLFGALQYQWLFVMLRVPG